MPVRVDPPMLEELSKVLSGDAVKDLDHVELRAQDLVQTAVRVRLSDVEMVCQKRVFGHSARVLKNGVWGFAFSDGSAKVVETVRSAAKAASAVIVKRDEERATLAPVKAVRRKLGSAISSPFSDIDIATKTRYLKDVCTGAREKEPRIGTCWADYGDSSGSSVLVTSEGTVVESEVSELTITVTASGSSSGVKASSREEIGIASAGWNRIEKAYHHGSVSDRVAAKMTDHLGGTRCRRGSFNCVLGPRVVGMLAHEALGHLSEADLFCTGAFKGLEGKRIAPDEVTMVDSPRLKGGFGNIDIDDEGVVPKKVVLIDEGVLGDQMNNRQWASRLGVKPTGNARAESYRKPPIIRMRNTYFERGDMTTDELIENVRSGYYCGDVRGGQAESNSSFQIGIQQCYEIVKGELGRPVRDLSISGIALRSLRLIDGVGMDFDIESSYCGKYDQAMATSDGGPHISLRKGAVVFGGA
jgi:predicted Zn-dependent protease